MELIQIGYHSYHIGEKNPCLFMDIPLLFFNIPEMEYYLAPVRYCISSYSKLVSSGKISNMLSARAYYPYLATIL